MKSNLHSKAIVLIEKALSGTLEIDEGCCFLSNLEKGGDCAVSDAAHAIVHFLTDADIRKYDEEYDQLLRAELEKYAEQLRQPR